MTSDELRNELAALHAASHQWSVVCCRGDAQQAAEVLQSSYVKALQHRGKFRGDSSLKTWLFAVIRNTAREALRKETVRRAALERWARRQPDAAAASSAAALENHEEIARVRAAVQRLSARQRQIVHLVFYETMTISQSAEILQISVGSARKHYERAKQRLRESVGSEQTRDEHAPC